MAVPKNIDIGFDLKDAIISGKAVLLREMMRNLVHNALEYSPERAKVTVRCGVDDGHCFLEVEDNGRGVEQAYRERVFEPFFRLPGTSGTGSGLGLAIAREVALAHGARIEIRDPASGQGTLVRVMFG
jgi:two-component system sensor histidine kinase TctE